jgi:RNA polymerase sigma-70 factor (ECF subfamily)
VSVADAASLPFEPRRPRHAGGQTTLTSGATDTEVSEMDRALCRAVAGDEAGFRELWEALQPRLLRYLRIKAGDAFEDVAAETWLQVVRDLSGFRGDARDFTAWLFTIARHRAIDAARARAARPLVLLADVTTTAAAARDVDDSAEMQAIERVTTREALALVASLPAEQAEMVALRVIAGLDVASVASIVGKSSGAVRVGVHRGLRALSQRPLTKSAEVT